MARRGLAVLIFFIGLLQAEEGLAMALKEGQKAPGFSAAASNGQTISLEDYKGKSRVVLYFYPKDDTPACTIEACSFRDNLSSFKKAGAVVLGVSPDGADSHDKFVKKFKLPFILLSDEDKKISKDYGVWGKKSFMGREYMGVARTTFIIGKDGQIEKIYEKVKPLGHAKEVLDFLNA
jgi:peroxiredoxin Q/BCP